MYDEFIRCIITTYVHMYVSNMYIMNVQRFVGACCLE